MVRRLNILQVNLDRIRAAHDSLDIVYKDRAIDLALVAEPNKEMARKKGWFVDNDVNAAIIRVSRSATVTDWGKGNGFLWILCAGVYIYSVYISPNAPEGGLERFLYELGSDMRRKMGPVLVGGDFNAKSALWGSPVTDKKGTEVSEWITSLNMVVMNAGDKPTFARRGSCSFNDVTIVSENLAPRVTEWAVLEEESLSTHNYITFCLAHGQPPRRALCHTERNNVDIAALKARLARNANANGDDMTTSEAIELIKSTINDARRRRWVDGQGRPVQWWTEELSTAKAECTALRRQLTRCRRNPRDHWRINGLLTEHKECKGIYRKLIYKAKRRWWAQLCSDLDNDPWGDGYKVAIRTMGVRYPKTVMPVRDRMEIARTLFPARDNEVGEIEITNWEPPANNISLNEVAEASRRIKTGRAAGPDGIPPEAVRAYVEIQPTAIWTLMKNLYGAATFPLEWKRAHLVLVPKPTKHPGDRQTYRPICLLSTLGKLLERIVLTRINVELARTGDLHQHQYGFRAGRSTLDALNAVLEIPRREGGRRWCILILFDVRNAFNTASWGKILQAMSDRGIDRHILAMIRNYLEDRVVEVARGREIRLERGVPQGSVLGPTLWNILYDGVLRLRVPEEVSLVAYADDLAAVVVDDSKQGLIHKCNTVMRSIHAWMNEHHLEMAPEKTKAILLTGMRRAGDMYLTFGGNRITPVPKVKYLGVTIDRGMTFGAHVEAIRDKAIKTAAALSRVMPNVGGPSQNKRQVIAGVVNSILLYAAPVWAAALRMEKHRTRLQQAQRMMALRVASAYRTVSTGAALVVAGMIPIGILVEERMRLSTSRDNKRLERERSIRSWQDAWSSSPRGAWTRRLIPWLTPWITRSHGKVDYWATQFLTGHGCFGTYLQRIKKRDTDTCETCEASDDPEHAVFHCTRWDAARGRLRTALGSDIEVGNILQLALSTPERWNAIFSMIKAILSDKNSD